MAMFDFGKRGGAENAPVGGTNIPVSQVLAMKSQGLNNNQIANQLRVAGYSLTQIRDALAQADIKSAVVPGFGGDAPGGMIPGGPVPGMEQMPGMPDMAQMPDMPQFPGMQGGMSPSEMEMPPLPEVSQQSPAFQMPQQYPQAPMQMPSQMGVGGRGEFSMEQLVNELQRVIEEIIEEKWSGVEDKLNALDMWKVKLEAKISELSNRVAESTGRIDEFSKGMVKKTEEYQGTMEEVGTEMEAVEKLMGKLVPSLAEEIKELRDVVDKLKKK
jgi:hypothetical protein